jgi:hypothetical protein
MPSLIDAHFDLADIEAQLSSTTFKLDAFFEDEPEDEDHMIDPSSPFMPLDSGIPFIAKGHGALSFDLAVSKASSDDLCSGNDDPRNAFLGRESSPTVCIDRLYGAAFSLHDSESALRRQEAQDRVLREQNRNEELKQRLQAATRAHASAARDKALMERQVAFLRHSIEDLHHTQQELCAELAQHMPTRPRGAAPTKNAPSKSLSPHKKPSAVGKPSSDGPSAWPACPSVVVSGSQLCKTQPIRRAPMVADYYWPQVVA